MGHPKYPWIERDRCGTCGGRRWQVIRTRYEIVARCAACLPKLKAEEVLIEPITLGKKASKKAK